MTRLLIRETSLVVLVAALVWQVGCFGENQVTEVLPDTTLTLEPGASDPITARGLSATVTAEQDVAYVYLPPGTVTDGGFARITNVRLNVEVVALMQDGGFDPVSIAAAAGDVLQIVVQRAGGAVTSFSVTAPSIARPKVVRAYPPPRKRDVPLNTQIVVVFSEPIRAGTEGGVTLTLAGARVSGRAVLSADGLRVEFQPTGLLAANKTYEISVSTAVRDLSGDALEQPVATNFTTGTTQIVASIATDPVALSVDPYNNELRTFTMTATLDNKGVYSGSWIIFYPGPGWRASGHVTCFSFADSNQAWIAGTLDVGDPSVIGLEYGWRARDGTGGGVSDAMSLEFQLHVGNLGTAQDFCANQPVVGPWGDTPNVPIELISLTSGNVVINQNGPPPPPLESDVSEIAFAAWPNGGIQVINADGSGGRVLTTVSDWNPAWSPDGTKLAFDRRGDSSQDAVGIYVINPDGSGLKRLTSGTFNDIEPTWSPNGNKIAFQRQGAIYVMNGADGSGLRALTSSGCNFSPTWSPDGSRIAFASCRTGTNGIYVMSAVDGSGERRLTSDSASSYFPQWSPDGTRIAFERGTCCAIDVINPDGSGWTQLSLHGRTPAWSPDTRAVVFEWYGLNVVNANGTGLHALGTGFDPAWSPKGTMPPLLEPAASVSVEPAVDTLVVGDTLLIKAIVRDAAGNVLRGRLNDWAFSDSVTTTDPGFGNYRFITAIRPGTTRIVAMIDGKSDTAVVVVVP